MKIVLKDFQKLSKAELIAIITQACEGFESVFFNDLELIAALEPYRESMPEELRTKIDQYLAKQNADVGIINGAVASTDGSEARTLN